MNTSDIIRRMSAAGAPPEAIAVAFEAIEEAAAASEAAKSAARERKRRQRERERDLSRDRHVTVTETSVTPPLPSPEEKVSPEPLSKTQTSANPSPPIVPPAPNSRNGFDQFWAAYPEKVGKRAAEAAYSRAVGRSDAATILAGVHAAKRSKKWTEGFVPNPATWLNQDRWLDGEITRETIAPDPNRFAQWTDGRWRAAVEIFAEDGRWHADLGPTPREPGCRAPPDVLRALGFAEIVPFDRGVAA